MSILGDVQSFNPDAIIELFVLDLTKLGGNIYWFHSGTNDISNPITWQGVEYTPMPVKFEGASKSSTEFSRPKISISNYAGAMTALIVNFKDLVGAKITRKRTLARYLDAVNFTGGNPTANPSEAFSDDVFYIVQKTQENRTSVQFELGSALDLQGVMLPRGQVIANVCRWRYRGEECGYTGGPVADKEDVPTSDSSKDACSRSVNGCKLRFGENGILRFAGYRGAALVDV